MLIVFEGIDGTGKSTQVQLLKQALERLGHSVITSFEPTNGVYGQKLRNSATQDRFSLEEEVELFLKDRQEHVQTLIQPHLQQGGIVLLDRYYFSNIAYQSVQGGDPKEIQRLNEAFAPLPDLLFLLDLPVEIALKRIHARNQKRTLFENTQDLQHCRKSFLSFQNEPFAHLLSADASPETIHHTIWNIVTQKMEHNEIDV